MKIWEFALTFFSVLLLSTTFIPSKTGPMSGTQVIATVVIALLMVSSFKTVSKKEFSLENVDSGNAFGVFSALISFAVGEAIYYLIFLN